MKKIMKRNFTRLSLFCVVICAPLAPLCRAQTTPFLSDGEIRMLSNEISGDRAFEHIRWLSHWHRDSGMEGYRVAQRTRREHETPRRGVDRRP